MSARTYLTKAEERQIRQLESAILQARKDIEAIRAPVELARLQGLVGRCYRFENSYGGRKRWHGYLKVLRVEADGHWLRVIQVEARPDMVVVQPFEAVSPASLERYEEVSLNDFRGAVAEVERRVAKGLAL